MMAKSKKQKIGEHQVAPFDDGNGGRVRNLTRYAAVGHQAATQMIDTRPQGPVSSPFRAINDTQLPLSNKDPLGIYEH